MRRLRATTSPSLAHSTVLQEKHAKNKREKTQLSILNQDKVEEMKIKRIFIKSKGHRRAQKYCHYKIHQSLAGAIIKILQQKK
jgi:hypothetical protein